MVPTLVALAGPSRGAAFPLERTETSVGRDPANSVVLADASVSPRHCVLLRAGGQVTIRDLDPTNPSFVNGLPASERRLENGDRIRIGGSTFALTTEPRHAGEPLAVGEEPAGERPMIVMRREDVFADGRSAGGLPPDRLERDLAGLMRVSAAISSVRGLVALERPLIELIAEVVPADRGARDSLRRSEPEIASVRAAIGRARARPCTSAGR